MTEFHEETPVSQYGAARKAAWLAGLRANANAMTEASMKWHQADHDIVTQGQLGLYGSVTPQQQAAMVAAQRRVGDDWGQGRELQSAGGTMDPADYGCSPAPARADLRSTAAPPGFMRTENPLDRINRGQR